MAHLVGGGRPGHRGDGSAHDAAGRVPLPLEPLSLSRIHLVVVIVIRVVFLVIVVPDSRSLGRAALGLARGPAGGMEVVLQEDLLKRV